MRKILLYILILSTLFLSACKPVYVDSETDINKGLNDSSQKDPSVTTGKPINADVPTIVLQDYNTKIEAEDTELTDGFKKSTQRADFSGTGYVTGLGSENADELSFSFDLPENQHYSIFVCVSSKEKQNNTVSVNGKDLSEIISSGNDKFENLVIEDVYMSKGTAKITIKSVTGGIDIDYVMVRNCDDVFKVKSNPFEVPCNPQADEKTQATLRYLVRNYGKKTVSGQYAAVGSDRELELVHKITGKYPAIRGGDMMGYTSDVIKNTDDVSQAIKWSHKGGIVSYVWHWEAPGVVPSYYSDVTDFRLSDVVTDKYVADKSIAELQQMVDNGEISDKLLMLIDDIDLISEQLSRLQDNGVTVLWRPLHEASGGWFWWGASGKEEYKWLWNLLYERQTYYHKLNNLIWVWNAQNTDWYVGDNRCDIISADIYGSVDKESSYASVFVEMSKASDKKLIAISECDTPPEINFMLRDKSVWSWFGVWGGQYLMDDNGEYSESYTTAQRLRDIYNHVDTVTLEDLPDFNKK